MKNGPILFIVISALNSLFYISYNEENNYVYSARKTWENQPIQFISTIQLDGYQQYNIFDQENIPITCDCTFIDKNKRSSTNKCSPTEKEEGCIEYTKNKAFTYKDMNFYVKYYPADYYTLFSRIDDENKDKCKNGFKSCGFLDAFNNSFCIDKEEECPVNFFNISNHSFSNIGESYPIINQIYVSESDKAIISDINYAFTQSELENLKNDTGFTKDKNFYKLSYLQDYMNKSDFIKANNLIIGEAPPNYFNNSKMYLYHLVYPGNLKNYTMTSFYLGLIHFRLVILFIFIGLKILLGISFFFLDEKELTFKKTYILFIVLTISYITMFIFNFLFFVGRFHLHAILQYYEENVFKSEVIKFSKYLTLFVWEIIFSTFKILNIINKVIIIFHLKLPKKNKIGLVNGLMRISLMNKTE